MPGVPRSPLTVACGNAWPLLIPPESARPASTMNMATASMRDLVASDKAPKLNRKFTTDIKLAIAVNVAGIGLCIRLVFRKFNGKASFSSGR